MAADELIEVKFRLADGTDIGPSKYSSITTVGSLKEKIISQWPKVLPCHMHILVKKKIKSKLPFWSLWFGHFCHFTPKLKLFASGSLRF
ncbi:putative Ubiquitin-like domain superfamily, UBL3-like, ubiquitin domain-containing protein [Helianthus annuus]|nr:putative Ubiquitin-like domain superfamily, UBL3-like, ubiquitin domain-containing protein [Helianthus annuus]